MRVGVRVRVEVEVRVEVGIRVRVGLAPTQLMKFAFLMHGIINNLTRPSLSWQDISRGFVFIRLRVTPF